MDTLFDYAGLQLPRTNPIVSDIVLKNLASEAADIASKNSGISAEIILNDILPVFKNYFSLDNEVPITDPNIRHSAIQAMSNYLCMQDILECRSMKEIHILASGLYDSVISYISSIIKTTTLKEVQCNVFPYFSHPKGNSDNFLEKLQAAD